ncbi:FKBP-type peptidyl-prolyl cis-trans isomerase, partial [Flavobacterium sp. PLA-1-15]|uniref:FKBP-type peptidyl-prolyl cis-trans isomerase n=1 Tax=Flavobacterium sp. PLA-1-15 TaxID=3380533 RepID=UPI003B7C02B6
FVTYRGWTLDNSQFDIRNSPTWFTFPQISSTEISVISGFRQFTSLLKSGDSSENPDTGEITFSNYGSGVVFIPSGLGYFNRYQDNIPSYSPLVFTVRLHKIRERDHDRDGVKTKYESFGSEDPYTIDTDGDGIPDFLDVDDDGDGYLTIREITKPTGEDVPYTGPSKYYPFDPIVDNPATPEDETETRGIPNCDSNPANVDYTNPARLRRHLDPTCH